MRVWLAGLFVMGGVFLAVVLMDHVSIFLAVPIIVALFFILCLFALVLFSEKDKLQKVDSPIDFVQQLQDWEAQGMLETEDFQTTRAFAVEASDDEGPHLFLELHDGAVLYLNGQYLDRYSYAEAVNEDEENEDEENEDEENEDEEYSFFPCTKFTLKRHRENGQVVEILCQGDPLGYDTFPLTFWESDYWNTFSFYDGEYITDRTYDQLKRAD